MKKILSGNEAVARGAYEAGISFAAAYPGTPSTEILETIAKEYREIHSEWAPMRRLHWKWPWGRPMQEQDLWPS
jgi:indolepyruvate ferredoxin oxidoreductase alpha subunit